MLRNLRVFLTLALLAGLVPVLLSQTPATPKRYALVVGINEYQAKQLGTLNYAARDAVGLGDVLEQSGYQVVRLTSASKDERLQPTRENIDRELNTLLRGTKKGDVVVLAFAGHGLQFVGEEDSFFCPSDARPDVKEKKTLLSMQDLYGRMEQSFATCVVLVDACRNDPGVRAAGKARNGVNASAAVPKGVAALFSCEAGEFAYESDDRKHGLFFYHALERLRKAASEGEEITFNTLADHVQDRVPVEARESHKVTQTPVQKVNAGRVVLLPKSTVVVDARPLKAPFGEKEIREARAAWAKKLGIPAEPELDLGGGVKMKFVLIPPGEFDMGSADDDRDASADQKPRRRVTLTQAFYLQTTEMTQEQYVKLTGKTNPSKHRVGGEYEKDIQGLNTTRFPVENVDHSESLAACQAAAVAARKAWLPARWSGVLPREAEWEYACRSGSGTKYHFGDEAKDLGKYAWTRESSTGPRPDTVGVRLPNGFGLFDMHGNVDEWCEDWYDEQYYSKGENVNPRGSPNGNSRVLRGGSFNDVSWSCRAAFRYRSAPGYHNIGFRVCFRPD